MDQPWRIDLFGGLRVHIELGENSREITRFRTQKTGGLLAYLAYYLHRNHPREVLIDKLWPDALPNARQNSLRVALTSLRHQLEPPGVPPGSVIISDRSTVRLNPEVVRTDITEFEQAVRAARDVEHSLERKQLLIRVIDLYRGDLLAGYYDDWISAEQRRFEDIYFKTLHDLVELLQEEGDSAAARQFLQRGLGVDPLNEDITCDLIRLYADSGQYHLARQQYQHLERLLRQELDTVPSNSTQALMRSILQKAAIIDAELKSPRRKLRKPTTVTPDDVEAAPTGVAPPRTPEFMASPAEADATAVALPPPHVPTGTVTFLLIDAVGEAVEKAPQADVRKPEESAFLSTQDAGILQQIEAHAGYVAHQTGDRVLAAFGRARDAARCALAISRLPQAPTVPPQPPRNRSRTARNSGSALPLLRMALSTGDVEYRDSHYISPALPFLDQVLLAGHPSQILCTDETASLLSMIADPIVDLEDMGAYRFRGIDTPRRIFQVNDPAVAPVTHPPLKVASPHAGNLPVQFTRFFGREDEIAQLSAMLLEPDKRLVTLSGAGGSGKTRLALQVAGQVLNYWRGAVWFVPLADIADPQLIITTVRDALRLPSLPHVTPLSQVAEFLSHQPSLLLLDNFEHLVDQGAAEVQCLLEQVPDLSVLLTSQQRLNVAGEEEFVVPPLPSPTGHEELEQLSQNPSVQLFVDRAQAVRADFQITESNATDVAQLCRHLDGIPLAIELAAARSQVLTPAQMLANLEHRLDFFRNRFKNAVPRHRTLRAALDWSYQLLAVELQQFLDRLAVFRGGWTLEAAGQVAIDEVAPGDTNRFSGGSHNLAGQALELLEQLSDTSLILVEEKDSDMRFRMLETIQNYAFERLDHSGELEEMRRRHAHCFLTLAQSAAAELRGPQQQVWETRLLAEQDNLRAALEWSLGVDDKDAATAPAAAALATPANVRRETSAHDVELGLRLVIALWLFWEFYGNGTEGVGWLNRALSFPDAPAPLRAEALYCAGRLALYRNDFAGALQYLEESCQVHRDCGNELGVAQAIITVGLVMLNRNESERGQRLVEETLPLMRKIGDDASLVYALNAAAAVAVMREDFALVQSRLEEGLAILRKMQDKRSIALSLSSLGAAAVSQNDFTRAQALLEESFSLAQELDDKWGMAITRNTLGFVIMNQGDFDAARTLIEESLPIFRKLGIKARLAESLGQLGDVARYQSDHARAEQFLEESLALYRELDLKGGMAWVLRSLGWIALHRDQIELASDYFEQSLQLYHERGSKSGIVHGLAGLAAVAGESGQGQRAARLLGAAEQLRRTSHSPLFPCERADYECSVAMTRAVLSEDVFSDAWQQGQSLSIDQAVRYALEAE
jgi:predicted ATPase/DNA-binding SARP family transcriptional activator/class 3 adenylate cyclase